MSKNVFEEIYKLAERMPEKTALNEFFENGEEKTLTYLQLINRSKEIALYLKSIGCKKNDRVLLFYSSNIDYLTTFLGCIFSEVVAVPMYFTRTAAFVKDIKSFSQDCQTNIVLTTNSIKSMIANDLKEFCLYATDEIKNSNDITNLELEFTDDANAFILYTSGSTSKPKGVIYTQSIFSESINATQLYIQYKETYVSLCATPLQHIMGLLSVFFSLGYGGQVIFLSMSQVMKSPMDLINVISKYKVSFFVGPDFLFKMAADAFDKNNASELDLTNWKIALSGSEKIRPSTIENFVNIFSEYGFKRTAFCFAYGMTENGVISTIKYNEEPELIYFDRDSLNKQKLICSAKEAPGSMPLYDCGRVLLNSDLRIVDFELCCECEPNSIGEIWIKGTGVAKGYWNNKVETEQTFQAYLKNGEGPFLRTGDLGCIINQKLFITGRIKETIIIKGKNYYPIDIEVNISNDERYIDLIGNSVAFSTQDENDEKMIVIAELKQETESIDALKAAAKHIADKVYIINSVNIDIFVFVNSNTIPRTRTGKLRRNECRTLFINNNINSILRIDNPREDKIDSINYKKTIHNRSLEEKEDIIKNELINICGKLLNIAIEDFDLDKSINILGTDSITAFELGNTIQDKFGVKIQISELLKGLSINELIELIISKSEAAVTIEDSNNITDMLIDNSSADIEKIYANLDNYSEEELNQILTKLS